MKTFLLFVGLFLAVTASLLAQSRVSLAPSYWFNYNPYSYRTDFTYNGSTTRTPVSGHQIGSSFGLTARYHFTSQWDVSAGAFYYRSTDYVESPQSPYVTVPYSSNGWQFPVLVNYRLTSRRLSPYFSAGALFAKSNTYTGRPITTDGVIGVGVDYRLQPKLSLLLQPTFSYSFYRPANDAYYTFTNYSSYSLGLQVQLLLHL